MLPYCLISGDEPEWVDLGDVKTDDDALVFGERARALLVPAPVPELRKLYRDAGVCPACGGSALTRDGSAVCPRCGGKSKTTEDPDVVLAAVRKYVRGWEKFIAAKPSEGGGYEPFELPYSEATRDLLARKMVLAATVLIAKAVELYNVVNEEREGN